MIDKTLLNEIVDIARRAGVAIMEIYQQDFGVDYKEDQSPLTQADLAAHHMISAGLATVSPDIPVLSEEDVASFKGANADGYYWLVDPLDGTKEFIKKNGEFTVNIALIKDGNPVLGVVYAPALDWMYFAAVGLGAYKQVANHSADVIQVSKNTVEPFKVVGSRSHSDETLNQWLEKLGQYELIPMGSSLKICLVAEGRADIYPRLGPTSLWDTAAAHAILNVAGGAVFSLLGGHLSYAEPAKVLNPHFIAIGNPSLSKFI